MKISFSTETAEIWTAFFVICITLKRFFPVSVRTQIHIPLKFQPVYLLCISLDLPLSNFDVIWFFNIGQFRGCFHGNRFMYLYKYCHLSNRRDCDKLLLLKSSYFQHYIPLKLSPMILELKMFLLNRQNMFCLPPATLEMPQYHSFCLKLTCVTMSQVEV